jgi:hypothetical protein
MYGCAALTRGALPANVWFAQGLQAHPGGIRASRPQGSASAKAYDHALLRAAECRAATEDTAAVAAAESEDDWVEKLGMDAPNQVGRACVCALVALLPRTIVGSRCQDLLTYSAGRDIAELKKQCGANPKCAGFNTYVYVETELRCAAPTDSRAPGAQQRLAQGLG